MEPLRYGDPEPLVFESMVFGGECDEMTRRYATWAEAEAGHGELVALVRSVAVATNSEAR
jgi:hypothetical protein